MKGEKRHQMMQNLFGDQSEDEEEEEIDSEHESNRHPNYLSDEGEGGIEPDGEVEAYVEGQDEAAVGSEGELHEVEQEPGDSDGEREQNSQEVEAGDQQEESEGRETDSEGEYAERVVTSRRRDVIDSGSERSEEPQSDHEDDEVAQGRILGKSPEEERDQTHVAEIRDVFGDSDEEPADYAAQNDMAQEHKSPVEDEEIYEKDLGPDDLVHDEDAQYEMDEDIEENADAKHKDKPAGPPLEMEIPLRPPPAQPEKMNIIRVSNIMGIDPKPFDPKTYVEEDAFVTDESGAKKRIRLENNIVRWRTVKKSDGTISHESNARFVRWSDGSLQLLIGNEVLDITVQDAQHDHAYLFLRQGKGILQSQGKILKKMRFMPSSLSSNSHRLLTAIVDSRHKKVYKVKNCITDVDPEREKEQKEKAESQTIRANLLLNRKRERVNRKYTKTSDRGRQLSPGFLEDTLDEVDEPNYYDSRYPATRRRFEEDLEEEVRAEKRIINSKKGRGFKDLPHKSSMPAAKSSRRPVDFSDSEQEESEYESEEEEEKRTPPHKSIEDSEPEYEDSEQEEQDEEVAGYDAASEEAEEPEQKAMRIEAFWSDIRKVQVPRSGDYSQMGY
ncbi:hypothetical protein Nepgr_033409 [Nepenthes gracilis]|uniref:RNA polymerase-associated protein LEO1 n=1 Tax=Nepenthes gracilis TaxID=150966 RepID=A0AAD3TKE9_NEPGR|nr:hypothetical protein Nepgr_033409 [Nepenthes gracilis]